MKVYLDDDADGNLLILALTSAGFQVLSPRALNMRHKDDLAHLERAVKERAAILTYNCNDFKALHSDWQTAKKAHSGIFIVYKYNNPKKDMTPAHIAKAIANVLHQGIPIENQLHALNDYKY